MGWVAKWLFFIKNAGINVIKTEEWGSQNTLILINTISAKSVMKKMPDLFWRNFHTEIRSTSVGSCESASTFFGGQFEIPRNKGSFKDQKNWSRTGTNKISLPWISLTAKKEERWFGMPPEGGRDGFPLFLILPHLGWISTVYTQHWVTNWVSRLWWLMSKMMNDNTERDQQHYHKNDEQEQDQPWKIIWPTAESWKTQHLQGMNATTILSQP